MGRDEGQAIAGPGVGGNEKGEKGASGDEVMGTARILPALILHLGEPRIPQLLRAEASCVVGSGGGGEKRNQSKRLLLG